MEHYMLVCLAVARVMTSLLNYCLCYTNKHLFCFRTLRLSLLFCFVSNKYCDCT